MTYIDDMSLFVPHTTDMNGNEVPDQCDIRDGTVCDVNQNGIPDAGDCDIATLCGDPCEANSVEILPLAAGVAVYPDGGSGTDLTQRPYVMMTSNSEQTSQATVNHTCVEAFGEAGGLLVRGSGLLVNTTLDDGDFLMTVTAPTSRSAVRILAWLNADNWLDATVGNTNGEPTLHELVEPPTLEYLHSLGLGACGYYWDANTREGFVFANLDHASAFAASSDPSIPAVSLWGLATLTLLVLAAGTVVLKQRRAATT